MWDSREKVDGCSSHYEFRNIPTAAHAQANHMFENKNLVMSPYPCRCYQCGNNFFQAYHCLYGIKSCFKLSKKLLIGEAPALIPQAAADLDDWATCAASGEL